ncbi:peptidoglycan-associated lipoprotein Pal [Allosphingosinicella deserti]|uniref:Peptidoglycan-associated lipoprotein n=1 Tax=Allosphingosinicella deserti TaxID=2116704 RepID=A0A2P7QDW4_9SPHN|nr:peptidoglycan-associated lipoprotein Pal [Sphingomonas deserti]PSJ36167.1 peptidoglycan-associated lipoprotein Pal [Sphingomonas deserti]
MKLRLAPLALAAGAALVTSACAKKQPAQLPPAPVGSDGATAVGDDFGSAGQVSELEGLRRDMVSQAGADTVLFVTDSHILDDQARAILEGQARWLLAHPSVRITIEGHCDERGTREYNLALGERRANAAKNFLSARGVAASRMNVVSWGKERPAALGSDVASLAQNRRAVTVLVSSS